MTCLLRSVEPADWETIGDLAGLAIPGAPDTAEWLAKRRGFPGERQHWLAVSSEGEPVGYVAAERDADGAGCRIFLVTPPERLASLGDRLFEQVLAGVRELGSERAWAREFGHDPLVPFLQARGFRETARMVHSELEVAGLDLAALESRVARTPVDGLSIRTLAEVQVSDPDWSEKLYTLARTVHASPAWSLDEYLGRFDDPERVFVAVLGVGFAGYSYLVAGEEPGVLRQCMTGVRPKHRRRGIARALKLRTLKYAREAGFTRIRTNIAAANAAMRALNAELGFRTRFEHVTLERALAR